MAAPGDRGGHPRFWCTVVAMNQAVDALCRRLGQMPPLRWIGVTNSQLADALVACLPDWGWHPVRIDLSRFRKARPLQGPDPDAFDAFDLALFRDQLHVLVEEKEVVSLALYDETTGMSRSFGGPEVMLGVRDVLVVVGPYAHDPRWWQGLLGEEQVWRL